MQGSTSSYLFVWKVFIQFDAEAANCTDGWWVVVVGGFVLQQGSGGDCYDYDRDLNGPNVNNASTEHLNV